MQGNLTLEHLHETHDLSTFDCSIGSLNDWLQKKARSNEKRGGSRTYILTDTNNQVLGYYALASGALAKDQAVKAFQRNMPDPVPVILLGRLAVDKKFQGEGLGRKLLKDAILRITEAAGIIGARAILVHALSEEAKKFYVTSGFLPCPFDDMMLMLPI